MTISELGSIGELVAAVATIATLAYLALQIRQSNRSNQLAAAARIGGSVESWIGQMVQDPGLHQLYLRGVGDPESLTREERARFNLLLIQFLRATEGGWLQNEWGVVDAGYWSGICESIRVIVGSDAGRRAFKETRALLSPSFAAEVERIIGSGPTEGR